MSGLVTATESSSLRSRLSHFVRPAVVSAIVTGAVTLALLALDRWTFSSVGTNAAANSIESLQGLALLSLPLSWIVLIGLCLLVLPRRTRRFALKGALVCLVFNVIAIPTLLHGLDGKSTAFKRLAERSVPLVDAIHDYVAERGAPPPNLEALVPQYLDAVPSTGIGAYPDYEYLIGDAARARSGCDWMLEVPAFVLLGWDTFLYFPSGEYPERAFGGWLQRMGDWAYVHE